jgi:hypothetical protein
VSTVPPIRREVLVDADPATAFEVFTRHVEVTFAPAGAQALVAQTLVALTHEGWHAVVDPAAARAEYEQGWSLVLGRYRDHADQRVGFQNSATGSWPGLLRGPLVFAEEAAENGPALDPLPGEVGDRVIGPGRAELAAAMGSSPVVVGRVGGQDQPQMSLTEDQHPVGHLRPV